MPIQNQRSQKRYDWPTSARINVTDRVARVDCSTKKLFFCYDGTVSFYYELNNVKSILNNNTMIISCYCG